MEKDKFLIIDGSSLFFRAFYALPLLQTKRGIYTNAVYGFLSMFDNALDLVDPDYLLVCFDQKGKNFRHDMYEDYKGTRDKTPSELDQQWPILMEILRLMQVETLDSPRYEADDIAGSLAKKANEAGLRVYLLTGDRDYLQLVNPKTQVLLTKKGITQLEVYDPDRIQEEYGLEPKQLIDLKGLMGDSSDNIPGVPGIGEKTGIKLLKDFHSLEGLYDHLEEVSGKKRKENLTNYKAQAFLSRTLGQIVLDMDIDKDLDAFLRKDPNTQGLRELYTDYEFFSLLEKLPGEDLEKEDLDLSYQEASAQEIVEGLKGQSPLSLHILSEGKIYDGVLPHYLVIGPVGKTPYILAIKDKEDLLAFKDIFEDPAIEKLGLAIKDIHVLGLGLGLDLKGFVYDGEICEYILDPTKSLYSLEDLVWHYFNDRIDSLESIQGKGAKKKSLHDLDKEALYKYLAYFPYYLPRLREVQEAKIEDLEMTYLYQAIEMPLTQVLADMELQGLGLDKEVLIQLDGDISQRLDEIETQVYDLAGEKFNLNSPKQLSDILFDKMGLTPQKKTKTGYSTAVDVLEKIRQESPIIDLILDYRQLAKIHSTYIMGLLGLVNEADGRVHSVFQQTVTATGRLSSTDPNLQNIPIRTETGRLIRKAFKAQEGQVFIDGDYSQIELRILAHISQDQTMIQAFKEGQDIHRTTASQVFHVDPEEVSPLMRSRAKAVNFGIVYGISDYGLSQDLDISRKEAKTYIDNYLHHFPSVSQFMEDIVKKGKDKGYVETLFHRRRYLPELENKNFAVRNFGERVALNMPIQGTAADIIKLAMVKIYQALKERKLAAKLLLQVHDELIIEAPKEEVEEVRQLMKDIMEGVMDLSIPLDVDIEIGKTWYDTK
ncbi:MAG: DNA polymerase I [Tissierellia bacterium]|nr:DNA polymerase I [Tissierellia bacterium]